ncbi:MAG: lycopene cyclase domain protein [Bacteroidota bacterium]|nr:lycopene cyclase domain protein [Bacteroidota bacterium]
MLLTIAGPLLYSFDKRIQYYKKWKYLVLPFFVTGTYFIIWDHAFTQRGIWSFNNEYILGYNFFLLPVEEWMFFICVPFSCIFIYECVNYYFQKNILTQDVFWINLYILIVISITSIFYIHRAYTAFNFISAAVLLAFVQFVLNPKWLGRFYVAYFFSLIPFFIINGILTALPVVTYNNAENMGVRIFTIPVEDTIYCLLLLLMNVSMYEKLKAA